MALIRHAEVSKESSSPYTVVCVSRIDILGYVHISSAVGRALLQTKIVGQGDHGLTIDDRVFLGPSNSMLCLEGLYANASKMFGDHQKDPDNSGPFSPESLLYRFLCEHCNISPSSIVRNDRLVTISSFQPWDTKYTPAFQKKLVHLLVGAPAVNYSATTQLADLNITHVVKCAELTNPGARAACTGRKGHSSANRGDRAGAAPKGTKGARKRQIPHG